MIFREKLINISTGDERPGNILESKLADEAENITVDSSTFAVKYYYVKTPDDTWRKTQYYERVDNLFSITYMVNDTVYMIDYNNVDDAVSVPQYVPSTGYSWSGWLNDIPAVMPPYDLVIESTSSQIDYVLTYIIDNRAVKYEVHHYNDVITPYVPADKPGYTFSGWSNEPSTMPANDVEVIGSYTANGQYTLTYYVDSSVYTAVNYNSGATVISPSDPEIEYGYTWSNWINEPSIMPAQDYAVNSSLIANNYTLDYYIDSSLWRSIVYPYKAEVVHQVYEQNGYVFEGWSNEPSTMPAVNHYRVEGITSAEEYELKLMNDTLVWGSYQLSEGEVIPQLTVNKEGYTFTGWDPSLPTLMPSHDITTYATFTINKYNLTFVTASGNDTLSTSYVLDYNKRIDSSFYPVPDSSAYVYTPSSTPLERMPSRDYTIYGKFQPKPESTGTVEWYIDSSLIYSEVCVYDYWVTSPECNEDGYDYDWGDYDTFVMPHNDVSIYGEKVANRHTVYWYMDNVYLDSSVYDHDSSVYAPVLTGEYGYEWFGYDEFRMPNNDVSIYGSRVLRNMPHAFGVSIEQYDSNDTTPTVNFGYCTQTGDVVESSRIQVYVGFLDNSGNHIRKPISAALRIQSSNNPYSGYGDRGSSIAFDTNIQGKTIDDNGVIHMPERSSCKYLRLSISYFGSGTLTAEEKQKAVFYTILVYDPTTVNELGTMTIEEGYPIPVTYFTIDNNMQNCKVQVFGEYDTFYSYLTEAINNRFGVNLSAWGIKCSLLNNVVHAHNVIETSSINYITSGTRRSGTELPAEKLGYYLYYDEPLDLNNLRDKDSFGIETLPVNTASSLTGWAYSYRWAGCTRITTPPVLPATNLSGGFYRHMFDGCTSLTSTPDLSKVTSVAVYTYWFMFAGCTSLTHVTELPNPVYEHCYESMFENCTSLTSGPELNANLRRINISGCFGVYKRMFKGCTSLTQAPNLPSEHVPENAYYQMFEGCTSLVNPPIISGTFFKDWSCQEMFKDCTSLTSKAIINPNASYIAETAFLDMYEGCTSLPPEE